jgi:hypothetical protein
MFTLKARPEPVTKTPDIADKEDLYLRWLKIAATPSPDPTTPPAIRP